MHHYTVTHDQRYHCWFPKFVCIKCQTMLSLTKLCRTVECPFCTQSLLILASDMLGEASHTQMAYIHKFLLVENDVIKTHADNMMTSSNGNIFRVTSPLCGEFPAQRPVTRMFDVFFDLCLNKRLSKQSWGWWFKTPSRPLWRHCNDFQIDTNLGISILRWHLDNHGGWVPKITKLTVINLGQIIIWHSLTPNCNLLQNDQNTCISNHNLAPNTLTVNLLKPRVTKVIYSQSCPKILQNLVSSNTCTRSGTYFREKWSLKW